MSLAATCAGATAAAYTGENRCGEPTPTAEDALAHLGQRYSVGPKYLTLPAPSRAQLEAAVALALRSPDHRGLRPFRFVRVTDDQRDRLGGLFAADAARRGHGADRPILDVKPCIRNFSSGSTC